MPVREPESLGAVIAQKGVGTPRKKKQKLELLRNAWSAVVGERAAEHSRPTRLARGTLTVAADSAAWAAELGMMTETVMRRAKELLGEGAVKKVKVQARPPEAAVESTATPGTAPESAGAEWQPDEALEDSLSHLEDDEMREALLRLARAGKAGEKVEENRE